MEFEDTRQPDVKKPLIIAAMQDMGNVGSTVSYTHLRAHETLR